MAQNLVDGVASIFQRGFAGFARDSVTYQRGPGGAAVTLPAFVRGVRADELFGAASQGDKLAEVDCAKFRALFGAGSLPAKFDRLRTMGQSYTVEEVRGAPNDDAPVFFKLVLRGGTQ